MISRLGSILLLSWVGVAAITAEETPASALLVLNKGENSLAIVDPVRMKVVAQAPAGQDPHEVVASADGKLAFVSNYGGGHTLSVIDLVGQKALPAVELGALRSPHGLALADGKIYFTAEGSKVIGRYNPSTEQIDWVLGLGQDRTHMIVISKDASKIFTSNVNSDTISIVERGSGPNFPGRGRGPGGPGGPPPRGHGDGNPPPGGPGPGGPGDPPPGSPNDGNPAPGGPGGPGGPGDPPFSGPGGPRGFGGGGPGGPPPGGPGGGGWNATQVSVGHGPEGFDVSPDGKEVWAANSHDGTVSIIDVSKKTVIQTLTVPTRSANRLKFTLDGKLVFISDLGGGDLVVVDVTTRKEIKRLQLGGGSAGVLMEPSGSRAYVAVGSANGVVVIDLKSLQVIGHIDTGRGPDGLGWATKS
jgi:YVTN family beta-propeller protein